MHAEGAQMGGSRLVNRNVSAARGRTSMRLEPEFWDALRDICQREQVDIGTLIRRIEAQNHAGGRTSSVRVFIVRYFRGAATDAGHAAAGHGVGKRASPSCKVRAA
jgi:predicted DNA-binding ribbon-helix-helix protein